MTSLSYKVVVRREDDYEVWLDDSGEEEPSVSSLCIGKGDTLDAALKDAQQELSRALLTIERQLQQRVWVLTR